MDYKTLIIVAIIIGALFFFYRELTLMKDEMRRRITELSNSVDDVRDEVINEVKLNFDKNLDKIKTINTDCFQQIRKINMIHSQPIIRTGSHFTEVDSDEKNEIDYLSDMNQQKNPDTMPKNDNSPYMSKDDSLSINNKNLSTIMLNTITTKEPITNIDNNDSNAVNLKSNINNTLPIESNKQTNDQQPIPQSNEDKEIDIEDDRVSENNEKELNTNILKTSTFDTLSIANIMNEKIINLQNNDTAKIADFDNITIGSKKDIKKLPEKNIDDINDDTLSIETGVIKEININSFKTLDNYNTTALKKMAKCFGVSLSVKIDGKWKQYNKNDLYLKIKEYLSEKNK